jgi:phosphopantothenoylcysteine decarboxylase/phosphopantothenate--cysteine ligase
MAGAGRILICVTGGIAAYKVAALTSSLTQADFHVEVAMTVAAAKFVGPPTFEGLTGRRVHMDIWEHPVNSSQPLHIQLPAQADIVLVAPASADVLAKLAHGLADDLVSTMLLATDIKKILLAPAMNEVMWNHPATRANIDRLREWGVAMVGPESGWQACRSVGPGRMSEPDAIFNAVRQKLAAAGL